MAVYKKAKRQSDDRQVMNAQDQHGRLWLVNIDKKTGDPCGNMSRAAENGQPEAPTWDDPLETPIHYVTIPKQSWGGKTSNVPDYGKVWIDYHQWIRDQQNSLRDWSQNFLMVGQQLEKHNFKPDDPSPLVVQESGPKPWPPIKAIQLAQRGDRRYLLGRVLNEDTPESAEARRLLKRYRMSDLEQRAALGSDDIPLTEAELPPIVDPNTPPPKTPEQERAEFLSDAVNRFGMSEKDARKAWAKRQTAGQAG